MARVFRSNVRELSGRRFDPEFHIAMKSACRRFCYPTAKLRSLAYFQTGGTPSTERPEYWGGSVPWVSAKDFRQFRFDDSEDHITELAVAEATTRRIDKDAMLMVCRSGILQHTLPVMICQKPTAINQDIKAFFPDNRLTAEFLATFFDICGSQMLPLICKSGATVQSVNTDELMALDIPLPPLAIQRKIVAELDAAYTAKRKADQEVAALLASIDDMVLDELGIAKLPPRDTSLAARVFTVPLKEVAEDRLDAVAYQRRRTEFYHNVRCGKYGAVSLGSLVEVTRKQTDEIISQIYVGLENINSEDGSYFGNDEKESCSSAVVFAKGEILFPKLRPYLNKVWLAEFDGVASTEFIPLQPAGAVAEYLAAFLRMRIVSETMGILMTGNTLPRVQPKDVLALPVPVPPKPVQERIVRRASAIKLEAKRLKSSAAAQLAAAKKRIESELIETGRS